MNTMEILQSYGLSPLPQSPKEAMAYVPFQPDSPELCSPFLGYENGTIFKSLHKPFYGSKCGGGAR